MDDNKVITEPKILVKDELKMSGIDIDKINIPIRVYIAMSGIINEFIERDVVHCSNIPLAGTLYVFNNNKNVGIVKSNVGSPGIAVQVEDLTAGGVKEIIHLGYVGGIQPDLKIGELILTNGAFNDTGIAKLYGYDEEIIYSNEELTNQIKLDLFNQNINFRNGLHWTTDAGYRETWGQIKKYRSQNALCVEMEAIGLFTVARYRDIKSAAIYVISDVIDEDG